MCNNVPHQFLSMTFCVNEYKLQHDWGSTQLMEKGTYTKSPCLLHTGIILSGIAPTGIELYETLGMRYFSMYVYLPYHTKHQRSCLQHS